MASIEDPRLVQDVAAMMRLPIGVLLGSLDSFDHSTSAATALDRVVPSVKALLGVARVDPGALTRLEYDDAIGGLEAKAAARGNLRRFAEAIKVLVYALHLDGNSLASSASLGLTRTSLDAPSSATQSASELECPNLSDGDAGSNDLREPLLRPLGQVMERVHWAQHPLPSDVSRDDPAFAQRQDRLRHQVRLLAQRTARQRRDSAARQDVSATLAGWLGQSVQGVVAGLAYCIAPGSN